MKFGTRRIAKIAAFSVFVISASLGTTFASADEVPVTDPPPAPSISVYDTTVTQFESIEVRGINFVPGNGNVRLHVTEQLVTNPDPDPEAPPPPEPHDYGVDVDVQADGSFPVGSSVDETSRTFVEVFTNQSWPAGDYKVNATYADDLGAPVTTNTVDITVSNSDVVPALSSPDFDENGSIEQGKTFQINGTGWATDATGSVLVSLHQNGQAAEVITYETGVLSIVDGVLTGENTYIIPGSTTPGNYSVELNLVETDETTTSFARFPVNVVGSSVSPEDEPPAVDSPPDPPPVDDPPPPVVDPPAVVDPPVVVNPPAEPPVVVDPPTDQPPVDQPIFTPPVVDLPVAEPVQRVKIPAVETPKVTVGESDTIATEDVKKTDVESTGKADPKPSTDDETQLEALPGLTYSDKGDNTQDVTLAGAPQTNSISTTPLLIVLAAMGLLVGGVSVALKKLNT